MPNSWALATISSDYSLKVRCASRRILRDDGCVVPTPSGAHLGHARSYLGERASFLSAAKPHDSAELGLPRNARSPYPSDHATAVSRDRVRGPAHACAIIGCDARRRLRAGGRPDQRARGSPLRLADQKPLLRARHPAQRSKRSAARKGVPARRQLRTLRALPPDQARPIPRRTPPRGSASPPPGRGLLERMRLGHLTPRFGEEPCRPMGRLRCLAADRGIRGTHSAGGTTSGFAPRRSASGVSSPSGWRAASRSPSSAL